MIFNDRFNLRTARRDQHGAILRDALDLVLKRWYDGADAPLDYRRADHLQVMLSVWQTIIACVDYRTWEIREPDHQRAKRSPHPSQLRIAELAGLLPPGYDRTDPPDRVERAFMWLRRIGVISFTKQHREPKPDGSGWQSTGGALRRLKVKVLCFFGGEFAALVMGQDKANKKHAAQRQQREAEFRSAVESMDDTPLIGRPSPPLPAPEGEGEASAQRYFSRGQPPPDLVEEIMREQGCDWPEAVAEARRRDRERREGVTELRPDSS